MNIKPCNKCYCNYPDEICHLIIVGNDGDVLRCSDHCCVYGTLKSKEYITLPELVDGCIALRMVDGCFTYEDCINPKVLPLVQAFFRVGIETTLSGDMEGEDLVYVDLHHKYQDVVNQVILPDGWIVSVQDVKENFRALGLPNDHIILIDRGTTIGQDVRLCRRGGKINTLEANAVVDAIVDTLAGSIWCLAGS